MGIHVFMWVFHEYSEEICGYSTHFTQFFYQKWERVFVFWGRYLCIFSDFFSKFSNTFLNTFGYFDFDFGILWNTLEYVGVGIRLIWNAE